MSIFASYSRQTIPIPWDPPHEVTIQKLSGKVLRKAAQESLRTSFAALKDMGGASFQKELASIGDAPTLAAAVAQSRADPLTQYDLGEVLRAGIVSWTYEPAKSDETIADLDERSEQLLARAILALSLPGQTEEAQKNGSRPSTAA